VHFEGNDPVRFQSLPNLPNNCIMLFTGNMIEDGDTDNTIERGN